MKIIITMAGEGARFKKAGLVLPKYMLQAKGRTLFEWSQLSLKNFFDQDFIFLTRKEHNSKDFIKKMCLKLGIRRYNVIEINTMTKGQAETVLKAEKLILDTDQLIIYNIDTYVEPEQLKPIDIKGEGWVPSFKADGNHWSFVSFDNDNKVNLIKEKVRISEYGTIGFYYFRSFSIFKTAYKNFDYKGINEHYIAPLYSYLINNSMAVYTHIIEPKAVHVLGTPEEVAKFDNEFNKR